MMRALHSFPFSRSNYGAKYSWKPWRIRRTQLLVFIGKYKKTKFTKKTWKYIRSFTLNCWRDLIIHHPMDRKYRIRSLLQTSLFMVMILFHVNSIIDHKIVPYPQSCEKGPTLLYKVKWEGYDSFKDSWEPYIHKDQLTRTKSLTRLI